MQVHKIVIQVPYSEAIADEVPSLWWTESDDAHGPHIKSYLNRKDAETGERCVLIRCKHRSRAEVRELAERVWAKLQEVEDD